MGSNDPESSQRDAPCSRRLRGTNPASQAAEISPYEDTGAAPSLPESTTDLHEQPQLATARRPRAHHEISPETPPDCFALSIPQARRPPSQCTPAAAAAGLRQVGRPSRLHMTHAPQPPLYELGANQARTKASERTKPQPICPRAQMPPCPNAPVPKCPRAHMPQCPYAPPWPPSHRHRPSTTTNVWLPAAGPVADQDLRCTEPALPHPGCVTAASPQTSVAASPVSHSSGDPRRHPHGPRAPSASALSSLAAAPAKPVRFPDAQIQPVRDTEPVA
ncbi:hypothetical protein FA95DRAFT_1602259 [Auriscalpium vulgare]|uniref:Uncharacterized protein n=1 Tax=Auriscalpium vulgare TaxID=40419 RepID=A0ACB8S7V5_9AGAM|nr:hypothetical protein FA95DRAFT_1602259 [Auriscalpium vulgare]